MPTVNQYRVVLPTANDILDLRGIEPGEPAGACWICHIPQEGVRIAAQQRHVPVKSNSKSRLSLFLGCGLMTIVNMHLQVRMRGQSTEPSSLILDRMCADDSNVIRRPHANELMILNFVSLPLLLVAVEPTGAEQPTRSTRAHSAVELPSRTPLETCSPLGND